MKRFVCLLLSAMLLWGCAACSEKQFIQKENGTLVSPEGTEYYHLANEGKLYYLGELEYLGSVRGEKSLELGGEKTGVHSIAGGSENLRILRLADNEWCGIYCREIFDYSADRCIRLELCAGKGSLKDERVHVTCGEGVRDPAVIAAFLAEIRSQSSAEEAGLYDLVRDADGMLENCYTYGVIYGFFAEEPDLALRMDITSYNDKAYSVSLEGHEYVLPEAWLQRLKNP